MSTVADGRSADWRYVCPMSDCAAAGTSRPTVTPG